jgi:hypothetical protein
MHQSKAVVMVLLGILVGCAAERVASVGTPVRTARAEEPARKWQYFCMNRPDPEQLTKEANEIGQQGWELAAGGGEGYAIGLVTERKIIWCFKRPLP